MKRIVALVLLGIVIVLTGCAPAIPQTPDAGQAEGEVEQSTNIEEIGQAQTKQVIEFSQKMFEEVRQAGDNALCSPVSTCFMLSMMAHGARGQTLAELETVLGGTAEDASRLSANIKLEWMEVQPSELMIADSLWVHNEYEPDKEFLQQFQGNVFFENLRNANTLRKINKWAQDQTKGLIPEALDNLDDEPEIVLLDAIYLDAAWEESFEKGYSGNQAFYTQEAEVQAEFMNMDVKTHNCIQTPDVEGILLPFEDGRFAFLTVMPVEGDVGDLQVDISTWLDAAEKKDRVLLSMPKFVVTGDVLLIDVLREMGMPSAFEPGSADFGGISGSGAPELYISRVLQKGYIDVNEEGVRAGVVTSGDMPASESEEPEHRMIFNRPYVYAIVDTKTHLPFIMGTMDNPTAEKQ